MSRNSPRRLTQAQTLEILQRFEDGESAKQLAEIYDLRGPNRVTDIVRRIRGYPKIVDEYKRQLNELRERVRALEQLFSQHIQNRKGAL